MKNMLIIGMGEGLSLGVAQKFGSEGFHIGMISRNAEKLNTLKEKLAKQDIKADFATADVNKTEELILALDQLRAKMGNIDLLHYNAVDYRMVNIIEESADSLTEGFRISVANALASSMHLLNDLEKSKGSILLTGGGTAIQPNPNLSSISLGKAGIRNLAYQLHEVLKEKGIYVGTLTIMGWIQPDSETHSPSILGDKFWELYKNRNDVEVTY
jgi:short-subunit dehydrogenase